LIAFAFFAVFDGEAEVFDFLNQPKHLALRHFHTPGKLRRCTGGFEADELVIFLCCLLWLSPHQLLHPIIRNGLLLERVGTPLLPLACVGVVAAFKGLAVEIVWVFQVRAHGSRLKCNMTLAS